MSKRFFPTTPEPGWQYFAYGSLPRLALEPTMAGTGLFDGAWWPRSYEAAAELPGLITALGVHLGRIRRVALETAVWADAPRSITVNRDIIRIGWLAASAGTISISLGIHEQRLLLVVPPETDLRTAASAMECAATTGNHTPADELLGPEIEGITGW
ncbi:hypothetical protein GCM10009839_02300 [Catenulispora yoronensis]|uniref:Uncharacterized protein n=1 Tax=Catenulispora yoronensis TaxID=450799 RepID=A0ABN2TJH0_9ACTN